MANKLSDAILTFENDETANVGILHGIGGNFSSGHDLDELREDANDPSRFLGDDGFAVSDEYNMYMSFQSNQIQNYHDFRVRPDESCRNP